MSVRYPRRFLGEAASWHSAERMERGCLIELIAISFKSSSGEPPLRAIRRPTSTPSAVYRSVRRSLRHRSSSQSDADLSSMCRDQRCSPGGEISQPIARMRFSPPPACVLRLVVQLFARRVPPGGTSAFSAFGVFPDHALTILRSSRSPCGVNATTREFATRFAHRNAKQC